MKGVKHFQALGQYYCERCNECKFYKKNNLSSDSHKQQKYYRELCQKNVYKKREFESEIHELRAQNQTEKQTHQIEKQTKNQNGIAILLYICSIQLNTNRHL